jgi:hypothetical protein
VNNDERELWIRNDAGMYSWWQSTRLSMSAFIRENRAEIDAAIKRVLDAEPEPRSYIYRGIE